MLVLVFLAAPGSYLDVWSDSAEAVRKLREDRRDGRHADLLEWTAHEDRRKGLSLSLSLDVHWIKAHAVERPVFM